jgi:hypothetical protein
LADVLSETFDVEVEGETYTFKTPSIKYSVELGYRSADVRQRAYPQARGELGTIDMQGVMFSRNCAILELYLVKATTLWPYGVIDDSKASAVDFSKSPVVDFEKFPADCEDLVMLVGGAFEEARSRFRTRRNRNAKPASAEAVASE